MECERLNDHCKEELESLLGPNDTEVDFSRILEEAMGEKGCAIFETFSTVRVNSWWSGVRDGTKHQRRLNALRRHNSSASSSERQW